MTNINRRVALAGLATIPTFGVAAAMPPEPMTALGPEEAWARAKRLIDELAVALEDCDGGNWQAIVNPVSRGPTGFTQLGPLDAVDYHLNELERALRAKYPGKWTVSRGGLECFDRVGGYHVKLLNKGERA